MSPKLLYIIINIEIYLTIPVYLITISIQSKQTLNNFTTKEASILQNFDSDS